MGAKKKEKILHSRLSKSDMKSRLTRGAKSSIFSKCGAFSKGGGACTTIKGLHSGRRELWRNACWQTGIKESGTPQAKYHTRCRRWHATVHTLAGTTHLLYISVYVAGCTLRAAFIRVKLRKMLFLYPDRFSYVVKYRNHAAKENGQWTKLLSYFFIWNIRFDSGRSLGPQWGGSSLSETKSREIFPSGNKVASTRMRRAKTFWPDSDGHTQHSSHCSWPGKNIQSRTS